jgi:hypothetical protein
VERKEGWKWLEWVAKCGISCLEGKKKVLDGTDFYSSAGAEEEERGRNRSKKVKKRLGSVSG